VAAVFVDRPPGGIEADVVLTDNAGGARSGVAHLIGQGHRHIGYLGDAPHIFTAAERLRGYRMAMEAADLPVDEGWICMEPPTALGIRLTLARLLAADPPVSAVFCGNNRITVLVLRELTVLGRERGPALVGFDDFELADLLGVTVVAQNPAGMGRIAAELLFRRLAGESGRPQRIEMPTTLLVRESP
jgi:LacI family transcriptional regulator